MDKTELVNEVAELFRLNGHSVETSVRINHREIDVVARELQGLIPKTILIECADYADAVGVDKIQVDLRKLEAAREDLREGAVLVHISRNGYSSEASGYALAKGLSALTFANLKSNLINFDRYIAAIEHDRLREVIIKEYQPTTVTEESSESRGQKVATSFLDDWLYSDSNYLILLGDYGVGKSWLLRRYLYILLDRYKSNKNSSPLPFFVPLQRFTKAFDFQNLILKTFESYGLSGVHYDAFLHLVQSGRVVMLLDSFDEMAQNLNRNTIRENLIELFSTASASAKFVMTSRPNYFENKAERILLVERYDHSAHPIDKIAIDEQLRISDDIERRLRRTIFARVNDLTMEQRTKLFSIVLSGRSSALQTLTGLLKKFQALNHLSQRAVIARLLTTVAETLASSEPGETIDGEPLVPSDVEELNQAKIFQIVLHNLLQRDHGVGSLSARDRLNFLKRFAVFLQRKGSDFFATPDEVRSVVRETFGSALLRTDAPEQEFESYYRTCRRHSGLTTEGQFYDTSGVIDLPVSEHDLDSRIGFSHNSLREYLVSISIIDYLENADDEQWKRLASISISDLVVQFFADSALYRPNIINILSSEYLKSSDFRKTDFLFEIISKLIVKNTEKYISILGVPPKFKSVDLSGLLLANADLAEANFHDCLLQDTNLENSVLMNADFSGSIFERVRLDGAKLSGADFTRVHTMSLYVYDDYNTRTTAVLEGHRASQWLYSRGAKVAHPELMNPYLGKPWYEAAREVTRTLEKHSAGTHQQRSLAKGTLPKDRRFAEDFVEFLLGRGILERVRKSSHGGGWVVKLNLKFLNDISEFSSSGKISESLRPFFEKVG